MFPIRFKYLNVIIQKKWKIDIKKNYPKNYIILLFSKNLGKKEKFCPNNRVFQSYRWMLQLESTRYLSRDSSCNVKMMYAHKHWSIPMTWSSSDSSSQSTKPVDWLSIREKDIKSNDTNSDSVIFNVKSAGQYTI